MWKSNRAMKRRRNPCLTTAPMTVPRRRPAPEGRDGGGGEEHALRGSAGDEEDGNCDPCVADAERKKDE
eukprot:13643686-Alexandrium_andersonii.AAC.1